jgi:excisionase family DNA binding protein
VTQTANREWTKTIMRKQRNRLQKKRRPALPAVPGSYAQRQAHALPTVAERLSCSIATVRRRIAEGSLVAVTHGRVVRVLDDDLEAFIEASRRWR